MICQRCNISSRPALRCLVSKGEDVEVERLLCRECRELTRQTYPVTVLDEPPEAQETPQAAPQAASAPAAAPKGRQPARVHKRAGDGGPVCRQAAVKDDNLTNHASRVSCRRCLKRL